MKILHASVNIAGQATLYRDGLRVLGHQADVAIIGTNPFSYNSDISLELNYASPDTIVKRILALQTLALDYDIIHLHFFTSLVPPSSWNAWFIPYSDLHLLKAVGKKIFMQFWGCDFRSPEVARSLDEHSFCHDCSCLSGEEKLRNYHSIEPYIDSFIFSHPVHNMYYPGVTAPIIRPAIDLTKLSFQLLTPPRENEVIKIVHAPSDRRIKGTDAILAAIETLKYEGYSIELKLVENVPNNQALSIYNSSHIVIDQLRAVEGGGILALECMALGRVVVCSGEPAIAPDMPTWRANPSNITARLRDLLNSRHLWSELSLKSREFVEENHDHIKVATQLAKLYEQTPSKPLLLNAHDVLLKESKLLIQLGQSQAKVAHLNTEVAHLNTEVAHLNTEVAHLNTEVAHLNTEVAHLNTELVKLEQANIRVKGRRRQRVLVLSHMFPHAQNSIVGCFVAEQVKALRHYESLDVRVVCCLPYWMNYKASRPLSRHHQIYLEQLNSSKFWSDWDGIPVMYLPYRVGGFIRFSLHSWSYCSAITRVADWIWSNFKFDLIHAHTAYLDGSTGVALSKKYKVPLIITEHTGPFSALTSYPVVKQITINSLKKAERVICVSEAMANQVRQYLSEEKGKSIKIFPNGFHSTTFYPSEQSNLGEGNNGLKLLFVGSLDDNKNPMLLLKAFDIIREKLPYATLTIVGVGPLASEVESWINAHQLHNYIFYLGAKSRNEVAQLMREQCDIFVLPSNSETFGCVVMEAIASGKPVVSTRCGGPEDIITSSLLGELCPTQDPKALAQSVINVASSLHTYNAYSIADYAKNHFGYEFLATKLAELYQTIG